MGNPRGALPKHNILELRTLDNVPGGVWRFVAAAVAAAARAVIIFATMLVVDGMFFDRQSDPHPLL